MSEKVGEMEKMEKTYTPQALSAIAEQTAQEIGAEVIRWWQDEGDPRQLYIEATTKQSNIFVLLMAILPDNDACHTDAK